MHVRTNASVGYQRKFHNATGIRLILTHSRWTLSHAASPLCFGVWSWLSPVRSSTPTAAVRLSPVQPQLPSAACLSALQPPTVSLGLQPPTASLWVASSTLIRLPVPLPGTARFQVQESFVWFRAKTDSSALAAYPHSATYHPLLPLSFILNKLQHNLTSKKKTRTFTGSKIRT